MPRQLNIVVFTLGSFISQKTTLLTWREVLTWASYLTAAERRAMAFSSQMPCLIVCWQSFFSLFSLYSVAKSSSPVRMYTDLTILGQNILVSFQINESPFCFRLNWSKTSSVFFSPRWCVHFLRSPTDLSKKEPFYYYASVLFSCSHSGHQLLTYILLNSHREEFSFHSGPKITTATQTSKVSGWH